MKSSKSRLRAAASLAAVSFVTFFMLLWWGAGLSLICDEQLICYVEAVTNHLWKPIATLAFVIFVSIAIATLSFVALYREGRSED